MYSELEKSKWWLANDFSDTPTPESRVMRWINGRSSEKQEKSCFSILVGYPIVGFLNWSKLIFVSDEFYIKCYKDDFKAREGSVRNKAEVFK